MTNFTFECVCWSRKNNNIDNAVRTLVMPWCNIVHPQLFTQNTHSGIPQNVNIYNLILKAINKVTERQKNINNNNKKKVPPFHTTPMPSKQNQLFFLFYVVFFSAFAVFSDWLGFGFPSIFRLRTFLLYTSDSFLYTTTRK